MRQRGTQFHPGSQRAGEEATDDEATDDERMRLDAAEATRRITAGIVAVVNGGWHTIDPQVRKLPPSSHGEVVSALAPPEGLLPSQWSGESASVPAP
jgi:hypothetical protein